jgi:hypothetical protein
MIRGDEIDKMEELLMVECCLEAGWVDAYGGKLK